MKTSEVLVAALAIAERELRVPPIPALTLACDPDGKGHDADDMVEYVVGTAALSLWQSMALPHDVRTAIRDAASLAMSEEATS